MTEEEIHYLSSYGHCRSEECLCAKGEHPQWPGAWGGIACDQWEPIGARSHEELMDMVKQRYRQSVEMCGND